MPFQKGNELWKLWGKPPFLGKHHTLETRQKISKNGSHQFSKGHIPWNIGQPHMRRAINWNAKENLAYIVGVIAGDGTTVASNRHIYNIILGTKTESFNREFELALERIGLHARTRYYRDRWITRTRSKSLFEFYQNLMSGGLSTFLSSYSVKRNFVKAFYESEGGYYQTNNTSHRLEISNTNEELIHLVQDLLNEAGYKFTLATRQEPRGNKPIFLLRIYKKQDIKRFIEEIHPCIKYEPLRYNYKQKEVNYAS